MARVAGIELQDNWKIDYALTRVKGIGWTLSKKVLSDSKIKQNKRVSEIDANDIAKITAELEKYAIEGDLIRQIRTNITRLKTISSYRGVRHARGLPARGQRTRHNARAKRGKRKTVGAFRKDALAKMTTPKEK